MIDLKKMLKSRTIWGGVLMLLGWILRKLNVNATEAQIEDVVDMVFQVIGFALVLYGRAKAKGSLIKETQSQETQSQETQSQGA